MSAAAGLESTVSDELKQVLGDRLSVSPYDLESHGVDESYHDPAPPDAVAFVESTAEAATVVKICADRGVPVIPPNGCSRSRRLQHNPGRRCSGTKLLTISEPSRVSKRSRWRLGP